MAIARAGTAWPEGELGAAALAAELQALQHYAERVRAAMLAPLCPPLLASLQVGIDGQPWTLSGALADLRANGLVRWRHARASGADLLDGWLHHLLLCLGLQQTRRSDALAITTWLAADRDWVFEPVADPSAELQLLLRLYAQGQQWPLHFYHARPGPGSTSQAPPPRRARGTRAVSSPTPKAPTHTISSPCAASPTRWTPSSKPRPKPCSARCAGTCAAS